MVHVHLFMLSASLLFSLPRTVVVVEIRRMVTLLGKSLSSLLFKCLAGKNILVCFVMYFELFSFPPGVYVGLNRFLVPLFIVFILY